MYLGKRTNFHANLIVHEPNIANSTVNLDNLGVYVWVQHIGLIVTYTNGRNHFKTFNTSKNVLKLIII